MSAHLIKYRTDFFSDVIEMVGCTRQTEKSVYVVGHKKIERREAKRSEMAQYHDSWSDAREYLRVKAQQKRDEAAEALTIAEAELAAINDMVPPRGVR